MVNSFTVPSTDATYYVALENGPGGAMRVSSAVITINGVEVITPEVLNQQVGQLEYLVLVNETNEIAVELRGTPLSTVSVKVFGVDNDLPSISATVTPEPNNYGWNKEDVLVSFECVDTTSGIAVCSDPATVDFETIGEVVTGTAIDNAGNTAETYVTVRLDKTPPEIARTWPPADDFSTDRSDIRIEGRVEDTLSGFGTVELLHAQDIIPLSFPELAVTRVLDTDIAPGMRWTDNAFELRAIDQAGNLADDSFLVRHTQMAHTLPTDASRTELDDGLLTSVDTAIVRFEQSVARDTIDDLIAQEGGRVVGFLPETNTATVVFETDLVTDLKNVVNSLKTSNVVEVAVPAIFLPEIQFDNELLSPLEGAAYDNIRSAQAKEQVIPQVQIALDPVKIAVIDTGMDDSHGQDNEFSGINFYDLCTAAGQLGQTGTPVDTSTAHGTKITGIVAGANNGAGNNGVIRGIATSQFDVNVFRMNCGNGNDPALVAAAMDLIIGGSLGEFDVVNMSFGAIFSNTTVRDDVRAIYEGYFDSRAGQEILWVGGAGNDNQEIVCNEFLPSGLACDLGNVVSVGGYNPDDLMRGLWTGSSGGQFGSNWGDGVTLSAPGTAVWTATGPGSYGGVSGTSASAPLVTGAAAVMLAANPLSPSTVKQLLVSEAQTLNDPTLPEGGLDVLALLQAGRSYVDLVFVSERNGNDEIYAMNADGSNQTNLTNNPAQDFWPRWSPDGQQMVFVSTRASNNVDIYVMNADGSGATRLTSDPGIDTKPSWSPDGRRIAFTSDRTGEFRNYVLEKQGSTWLSPVQVPVSGSTYDFAWSPDGLWLVFSAYDSGILNVGRKDIYKMNVQDGIAATNLTQTPGDNEVWPTWYPGEKIVFSSILDILSIEPDGSARTSLTQVPGQDNHPIWSPYGKRIAFMSFRDGNWEVYAMDADGSQPTNLTNHPGTDAGSLEEGLLSWSPDGDKVVYWTDRDGNLEIYVVDVNSLVNTRLTTIGSRDYFPQWRP
jgi:TolB protein